MLARRRPMRWPAAAVVLAAGVLALPPVAAASWTTTGSMSVPRAQSHTLTTLTDGTVLVAGGLPGTTATAATAVAERYDPATGTWTQTGSSLVPRSRHIAALLPDGRVLIAGGIVSPGGVPATAASSELYDPVTGTWSPTGRLNRPRYNAQATSLADGRVLVSGGAVDEQAPFTEKSAEIYDPATGAWTLVRPMANARYVHRQTTMADGRVMVSGGSILGHCSARDSAEVYDPAADRWTSVESMPEAHTTQVSELLPGGRVLVAGGWSLPQKGCSSDGRLRTSTNASTVFDPLTRHWSATAPMQVARAASASTALADGRVLAAAGTVGGETGNTRTATAEVFNPALNAWTSAGSLAVARSGSRAALLLDGRVLVAGGIAPPSVPQSSAEVFTP